MYLKCRAVYLQSVGLYNVRVQGIYLTGNAPKCQYSDLMLWEPSSCHRSSTYMILPCSFETCCDRHHAIRKYGGTRTRYTAIIPIVCLNGINDVFFCWRNNEWWKAHRECVAALPETFNGINPHFIVIIDNAGIHHIDDVIYLIETQARANIIFLPPYLPDLNPAEGCWKYHERNGMDFRFAQHPQHYWQWFLQQSPPKTATDTSPIVDIKWKHLHELI